MAVSVFTGADEAVLRDAVGAHVDELVGAGDRALAVDEFDDPEYELADVVAAANTRPMFTADRVVIARDVGRFTVEQLRPLVEYLASPNETTSLVLVAGAGRLLKPLRDAVSGAGGGVVNTTPPARQRDRERWIVEQAGRHDVSLSAQAVTALAGHFGEDVAELSGLLDTLVAAYGPLSRLELADIEPFLGERGGTPPWDLTDAIDRGDAAAALDLLVRMTGAGGRHPLQLMAVLHSHYTRLARLDGTGATTESQVADVLGIKPGFPARKALAQHRSLGGAKVRRAIDLLAAADLDLRGVRELPDDVVLEVLVARLARLST